MKHFIAIICAGPGPERGVSLNSARSLFCHLDPMRFQVTAIFVDSKEAFYHIDTSHLLSNTPQDFDFKLTQVGTLLTHDALARLLHTMDMVFPCIHGHFGEDGILSAILERYNIPFVGNLSAICQEVYPKDKAQALLSQHGFPTLPHLILEHHNIASSQALETFWAQYCQNGAILKPCKGGSSIGVTYLSSLIEAKTHLPAHLAQHQSLMLQPYYTGKELTLILIETQEGPVALLPTETQQLEASQRILDYRNKYLPTNQCQHFTPARLPNTTLAQIQCSAERVFKTLKLRDIARFDGWWDAERGFILNDINLISGMEENSFLFKQTGLLGISHQQTIELVLQNAYRRHKRPFPSPQPFPSERTQVSVLFGGKSAERQVSLMSGRNVWFWLKKSQKYAPTPYFLDQNECVWTLPYHLFLHHTCEEIEQDIAHYEKTIDPYQSQILKTAQRLPTFSPSRSSVGMPACTPLQSWVTQQAQDATPVFIALHGGIGENGTLQALLESHGVAYQGCGPRVSALCMDKVNTQKALSTLSLSKLKRPFQYALNIGDLIASLESQASLSSLWNTLSSHLQSQDLLIKPRSDGCSSGVVRLQDPSALEVYARYMQQNAARIPAHSLPNQPSPIELPLGCSAFIIEVYQATDTLQVQDKSIVHQTQSHWHELTVVVTETNGRYHAYWPSITVKKETILSVEEKFQGGTGINLTPPPESIISAAATRALKSAVEQIAKHLALRDYARLDVFFNAESQMVTLIEVNSLPALTPSTVLFQQALAEFPSVTPLAFLEARIDQALLRTQTVALCNASLHDETLVEA